MDLNKFLKMADSPGLFVSDVAFDQEIYSRLVTDFPQEELEKKMGSGFFADLDSSRNPEIFATLTRNSRDWDDVIHHVVSRKFRSSLLSHFGNDLAEVRGVEAVECLSAGNTEIKVGFHLSRNGYVLSPHTDTSPKLITLIVYLPEVQELPVDGAGTNFYTPLDSHTGEKYLRELLADQEDAAASSSFKIVGASLDRVYDPGDDTLAVKDTLKKFDSIHRRSVQVHYQSNRALAFVKSNFSWHDVRLTNVPEQFRRKSFYINFMIRPHKKFSIRGRKLDSLLRG